MHNCPWRDRGARCLSILHTPYGEKGAFYERITGFQLFGSAVRVMDVNGDPYFVGKDVAAILGYRDTSDALKKHVDEEDKGVGELPTPGGMQKVITINESGLYSLILSSKLPTMRTTRCGADKALQPCSVCYFSLNYRYTRLTYTRETGIM